MPSAAGELLQAFGEVCRDLDILRRRICRANHEKAAPVWTDVVGPIPAAGREWEREEDRRRPELRTATQADRHGKEGGSIELPEEQLTAVVRPHRFDAAVT